MQSIFKTVFSIFFITLLLITFSADSQTEAKLEINPSNLNLGEWPIGGWQEEAQLTFFNDGPGDIIVTTSDLDDPANVFTTSTLELPLTIHEGTSVNLGLSFIAESGEDEEYTATYLANWNTGKSSTSASIMANGYNPPIGDIYENPFIISIPFSDVGISTAFPIRSNYNIPNVNNANDIVYRFTLDEAKELDITIFNTSASPRMSIYAEDFNNEGGPMQTNAIVSAEAEIIDAPLFAGTYYLIISSSEVSSSLTFDINIEATEMPNPIKAFNPTPADGAIVLPPNINLNWEFGEFTQEYQVYFGTTYPPSTLLIDWTNDLNIIGGIQIPNIDPLFHYFWSVNVSNGNVIVMGDMWEFTTGLAPPGNLTAVISEIWYNEHNVILQWTSPTKALLSYNVYRDGVLIGTSNAGVNTFTDLDVPYNMDPCWEYSVEAIYDEGIALSNTALACISGVGFIEGNVTTMITGEPYTSGASLYFTSTTNSTNYTSVTDMDGHFEIAVAEDTYDITIEAAGYLTEIRNGVLVAYDSTISEDFILGEYPYIPDTVSVIEIDVNNILIEWDTANSVGYPNNIQEFNIYRQLNIPGAPMDLLGTTSEMSFTDDTWATAGIGFYKWGVEAVYINENSAIAFSDSLSKGMYCTVDVNLALDNGESPEGTEIVFTNTSNPYHEINYNIILDETGQSSTYPFIIGNYDIELSLPGYDDMFFSGVYIESDTLFIWNMYATGYSPANLYVTPTGFATWEEGAYIPLEPLFENFDTQDAFDTWEVIIGGNTADTWQWTTEYNGTSLDGSPFTFVNSDAAGSGTSMDELLISPSVNASMVDALFIEWDQNYQNLSGQDHFSVEVFDGNNWVEVYYQDYDDDPWPSINHKNINVFPYANEDFKIRFHYVAPGWNWNLGIDNVAIHSGTGKNAANEKDLQFYKVWHDGVFVEDRDTTFIDFTEADLYPELIPGETYLAEVAALYSSGAFGAEYEWTYLPSSSFAGPSTMDAYNIAGTDDLLITWSNITPFELVEINQGYGDALNAYTQSYGNGYGVVYDFSNYPDAIINSVDFRHSSWGISGTWNYNVHIIDWDTRTILASQGPYQTTGDDIWEEGIELGDISTYGASQVAILMEPLSNDENNAYPTLDSDNSSNPQGSIFGNLDDLDSMGSSAVGDFLMDVWIYTANTGGKDIYAKINMNKPPIGEARISNTNVFNPQLTIIQKEVTLIPNKSTFEVLGTNVYRNDSLLAFVPEPDTFYIDEDLNPYLFYTYCLASVYTEDGGEHTWTSPLNELCVEDITGNIGDCPSPENLVVEDLPTGENIALLEWEEPSSGLEYLLGYYVYKDGNQINDDLLIETTYEDPHEWNEGICYLVRAQFTTCLSDPSNEACLVVMPAIIKINSGLIVSPNPAKDYINVESAEKIHSVKIINYMGQVLSSTKSVELTQTRIETSSLSAGVYFVEVETVAGIEKVRIVISK